MMTASVGALTALYPNMAGDMAAFGAASNMLSGLDGLYMSIWMGLPVSEWLYKKCYRIKYGENPPAPVTRDLSKGEAADAVENPEEKGDKK